MLRLLDTFCCAGGAGMGYHRAGFQVFGVDIQKRDEYPFHCHEGDAVEYIKAHGHEFDAIHASPPCQRYSTITTDNESHPDLVAETREALVASGKPWVMENVITAPLRRDVVLCGEMFGLRVIRHRKFESSHPEWFPQPEHVPHKGRAKASGRRSRGTYTTEGYYFSVYGTGTDKGSTEEWQQAMGIDWVTTRQELAEAIPPAYTEWIGRRLIEHLGATT
jgi:hypothetical protein